MSLIEVVGQAARRTDDDMGSRAPRRAARGECPCRPRRRLRARLPRPATTPARAAPVAPVHGWAPQPTQVAAWAAQIAAPRQAASHQAKAVGHGLARTGLRRDQQVAPGCFRTKYGLLNRSGFGVVSCCKGTQQAGMKFRKGHMGSIRPGQHRTDGSQLNWRGRSFG